MRNITIQTARNVLQGEINKGVNDGALRTALEIAIETMNDMMVIDWHEGRAGDDLNLRVYMGYSREEYQKYVMPEQFTK